MKTDSNEIIELNVGGHSYTTSKTTIISYPDSMLARMVTGQLPSATDGKQRIFIDRDGPLFRHILNFLRDKRLNLPENFSEYAQLRQEADFYRIEPIINFLDTYYNNKLNLSCKNSIHSSMTSLASLTNGNTSDLKDSGNKKLYFTIISKLYQGSLESLVGCIRILNSFSALDANSKRFMNCLMTQSVPNSTANGTTQNLPALNIIDSFVCECKFMHEEKLICCKPCGLTGGTDTHFVNVCQAIVRLAKRYGITTGYWEDMFYLTLENAVPNREQLCSILNEKHNAKLLSSCVCDRRYDENSTSTLIERWCLPDVNSFKN